MKKGDIVQGYIERTEFPNKGILTVDGVKITVKNVIKGQKVECQIKKKRKDACQGLLREVVEASPYESRKPACPHFGFCGGCAYQTVPYQEQLKMKQEHVRKLIQSVYPVIEKDGVRLGDGNSQADTGWIPVEEEILGSPKEWHYRNKMEFSFGDAQKDGPLTLGLHKKGSFYDVMTTDHCQLVASDYHKILLATLTFFQEHGISFYHKMSHEGYLRHLLVRRAEKTGQLLVGLVTTSQVPDGFTEEELEEEYRKCMCALPLNGELMSLLHIVNDGLADVVKSDRTVLLHGKDYVEEELLGLRFKISVFSFFQTNSLGAEVLYERVRSYVLGQKKSGKNRMLFDLYSGTGTIAQILSEVADKVIGVEIVEEAVEAARENARRNGLTNCEFIAGDVLKVLDALEEKPDFIVLDPPRDGIHPKALEKIASYQVEHMIYISCKPTSLSRDLAALKEAGYMLVKYGCVDMFSQTPNVETVCLLSKLHEAKHYVNVRLDMDELDITSAESKATYEEIKAYVAEHHDGLKVSNLYIAQVKAKYGIIEHENYNKAKSDDARQPKCPQEKEEAIVEALKFFQMI